MRNSRIWLVATAVLTAACSPSKTDRPVTTTSDEGRSTTPSGTAAASQGEALVRLVNALPTSPTVDIRSGDTAIFSEIAYKTVTPFRELDQNLANFQLVTATQPAGTEPVAQNHEVLGNGNHYTVLVLPEQDGSGANIKVMRDELIPAAGKAAIRVIHAAPGIGEMDVSFVGQNEPLFKGVNYSNEAGFKDIDPVVGNVEIRASGDHRHVATVKGLKLEAGNSYTIVIAGSPLSKVETITFNDALTPVPAAAINN